MDDVRFSGVRTPYECPFAFEGFLGQTSWHMAYFTDSTGSDNSTRDGISNPYYFAIAAATNEEIGRVNGALDSDPEIATAVHGATVFALFCHAAVYDFE